MGLSLGGEDLTGRQSGQSFEVLEGGHLKETPDEGVYELEA